MKQFDYKDRYIIENYHKKNTFSSFLPGIAGKTGIPLWVFYANRGQAITSFGSHNKDNPILEFQPAVKAYHDIRTLGFRTFIKDTQDNSLFEPFSFSNDSDISQMKIGASDLCITDMSTSLQVDVQYFTLAEEAAGGLIRKIDITNTGTSTFIGEIIDGLPRIVPFGGENETLKNMANTLTAWMGVDIIDEHICFYRLNASTQDSAQVHQLNRGNFSYAFSEYGGMEQQLFPIYDPDLLFNEDSSFLSPRGLMQNSLSNIYSRHQMNRGKFPCAFFGESIKIAAGETYSLYSVYGHIADSNALRRLVPKISSKMAFKEKEKTNVQVVDECLSSFQLATGSKMFDLYTKNIFLDNILRGGYPVEFAYKDNSAIYHIYSRKHGDMERDYNRFSLLPEFYSRGFGNYRDINQNRRCDVFFQPSAGLNNIRELCNLLQNDGYNPLVIHGVTFFIDSKNIESIVPDANNELKGFLKTSFTPGSLSSFLSQQNGHSQEKQQEILNKLISSSEIEYNADFEEGFWIDHWTYNLDLIETYLAVFPDYRTDILFNDNSYTYYDNAQVVVPRSEKHFEVNGTIRQFKAVQKNTEKEKLIKSRKTNSTLMRANHGMGEIYYTHLAEKLFCLLGLKTAGLDARSMGVEMEADKPGWYDALNGLPGIFGSSISETCELLRLARFLNNSIKPQKVQTFSIAEELVELLRNLISLIKNYHKKNDDFNFWKSRFTLLEHYRETTLYGFSGARISITADEAADWLQHIEDLLTDGIERAQKETDSILSPTYFRAEATRWTYRTDESGAILANKEGWKHVEIQELHYYALPLFLEGPVKQLKIESSYNNKKEILEAVKASRLYDSKLKMFRVNTPLESEPFYIGRARSFTPGWLENGSIWMHMEYKFLLEILKADLDKEFWEEAKTALVPFMDPQKYGRSLLENSSFIVSSVHPDTSLHGRGFVGRLSGSTAEFLNMIFIILLGKTPFIVEDESLCFQPAPKLPGFLFSKDGETSFTFLGTTKITYKNPERRDIFGTQIWKKILITDVSGQNTQIHNSSQLCGTIAEKLRNRELSTIVFTH